MVTTPMVDAVLSYHMNPQTCGVAKFNASLAERLGVPMLKFAKQPVAHPLISLKTSEWPDFDTHDEVFEWSRLAQWYRRFDLFLHDVPQCALALQRAEHVYVGSQEIATELRSWHAYDINIVEAFCPSTIDGNPTRGAYRVLVFGMAHKLSLPHFEALKVQLDAEHPDYTIELSTAVHEGNPWDEALQESVSAMRGVFGDKLRVLGYLADDGLARSLQDVDAVATFFTPALRANNTTYWAAVEAGKTIYTNRDEHSPKETDPPASWDRLVELIRA